jgi:hypothetical protein
MKKPEFPYQNQGATIHCFPEGGIPPYQIWSEEWQEQRLDGTMNIVPAQPGSSFDSLTEALITFLGIAGDSDPAKVLDRFTIRDGENRIIFNSGDSETKELIAHLSDRLFETMEAITLTDPEIPQILGF